MKTNYAEIFKELVEQEGYELLSKYKTNKTKVKLKCPEGHEYSVIPSNFKNQGKRCPKCSNRCSEQAKEQFKELLESKGYELLGEYINAKTKVEIRCNKGHDWNVKPNNFKSGNRCPICAGKCPIQAQKEFLKLLDSEGYELLSEYKGSMIKVKLKCPESHIYNVKSNSFKSGQRCPKCAGNCTIQAKEHFLELLENEEYELISEYKNTDMKVELKCPNGHIWNVTPNNFKNYRRCPHCEGSTGQRLLQSMLEECNIGKVIYNDREVLGGLELDIYYPELNVGIEYQGNYWHNLPENIKRDKRKRNLCKEKDIKLIEVWDSDFMNNPDNTLKELWHKILYQG